MYASDVDSEKQVNLYELNLPIDNPGRPVYIGTYGILTPQTPLKINYDGTNINYYINNVLVKTTVRSSKAPLYMIALLKTTRSRVDNINYNS